MRTAFSLVELSIVLVILGLLTGGILAGQSLIRASELRSVTVDMQRYVAAIHSFRDKYMAIPGDMTNATRFWGRQNTNTDCVTNSAAAVNATAGTCDGTGEGSIGSVSVVGQSGEVLQLWRQLALAGLIEGSYPGLQQTVWADGLPPGKLSGTFWQSNSCCAGGASTFYLPNGYGSNLRYFGAGSTSTVMTPTEAWGIDTKLDDGKPAFGKVVAGRWSGCSTATAWNDTAAALYALSTSSNECSVIFPYAF